MAAAKSVESISWWWNPGRAGIRLGPEWFREKLHAIDPTLDVTWDNYRQRWLVFMKAPRVTHAIGRGWLLLFVVEDEQGEYQPLDERVFHRLYAASQRQWGDGRKYWDAVEREAAREKELAEKQDLSDTIDKSMEVFNHSQISVGYGSSNGSKFSQYHA